MLAVRRSAWNLSSVNKLCSRSAVINNITITKEDTTHLKSWKEIPGPSSLPIIGQLLHFLPGGLLHNDTESIWKLLFTNFGPIVRLDSMFGSEPLIFLFDAEASAHVLRSENWLPVRNGFGSLDYFRKKNQKNPDSPLGLLTDQNEAWKKFRSTVNPIMLQPNIIKLYRSTLEEVADDMIERMRTMRNDKCIIENNFDVEMNLWALESIGVVALGGRLNCLKRDLPNDSPEKKLIETVHEIFTITEDLDLKPSLWRHISTPKFRRAMKFYDRQVQLSRYFIGKAMTQMDKKSKDDEKGILQKLLEIDEEVAIIMASDMLFAGVDTTANTITATLYLLAVNQDKQDKLREEIMSNQETRPYLKACLKESIRMMPVVSGNLRVTTKEYNVMGYKIPKNMRVTFGHQCLSSLEEQFPRSKEYIPERWIAEKSDPLYHGNADPFAYNPFGFGVRSCIGRRIAELEIETFLTQIMKNFKVNWFGPPLKVRASLLNYTVAPFNFIFKDIK